jgi:shikimate kinase
MCSPSTQGSVSELGHRPEVALRDYAAAKQEVEN